MSISYKTDSIRKGTIWTRTDFGLLFIVAMLLVTGLVMVYSASYGFSLFDEGQYEGNPTFFFKRQVLFMVVGLVAMVILWLVDYHWYQRLATPILAATVLILAVMAAMAIASKDEDPLRWMFGTDTFKSVQPVEVAKIGAMIYIAVWLASRGDQIRDINLGLLPFSFLLGTMAGLIILQPDFSTAIILIATATVMFFVAGAEFKQLLLGFVVGGAAIVAVALTAAYRVERIRTLLRNPLSDPYGEGFMTVQALCALNSGGLVGTGLGQSQQKFSIYAPHTDCMFAITGEEAGFVGAILVVVLFALWTWRGLRVARHAEDVYGMLLAVGLTCWVTFQAILHMGVITALTPFTGTVLPFISYGGSSLSSSLAAVGILLSISRGGSIKERA